MKTKTIFRLLSAAIAIGILLAGCAKETSPYANEALPSVSVSAINSEVVLDQAQILLTLDKFIHKDVNVIFDVEGIEREALDLPEVVTIDAGAVKKTVTINIDEEKASIGDKQIVLTMKEVENATISSVASTTGLHLNVEDVALVNVSASDFDDNLEATITYSLSKKVTKEVVLTIGYDTKDGADRAAFPQASLTFEPTVTIPAGSKVGTLKVTANKSGVPEGAYQAHFTIAGFGSNAKAGTVSDATLLVNVGFQPTLASTADIYFRYASGWWYVDRQNLYDYYFIWAEPTGDGDAADMDYVKAAMYRCRDWVQVAANKSAWLAYWSSFDGYEAYVPNGCPQKTADKTGYWGWPMIMINDGAIEDLDEVTYGDGSYHGFLFGFDAEGNVMEYYQYALLQK